MPKDEVAADPAAERYRRAAIDALEQVDWCIGYLTAIRKHEIAATLSRNRAHIRTQLLGRPDQPVPTTDA